LHFGVTNPIQLTLIRILNSYLKIRYLKIRYRLFFKVFFILKCIKNIYIFFKRIIFNINILKEFSKECFLKKSRLEWNAIPN